MHPASINVSTGPVQVSQKVLAALATVPISHRSTAFHQLYLDTTGLLCTHFNVKACYLLTGSGTAANEAMLWQIQALGGKGLILANGEFGERLIEQASRASLSFSKMQLPWGDEFDPSEVENLIEQEAAQWILFCHCETSTGVLNDLDSIARISSNNECLCFVDCMSTVGTYSFDLSGVTMATASSGKGLASIPGLAIVFSNIAVSSSAKITVYLDLVRYQEKKGVPYTISSNLVHALQIAIQEKLQPGQFELLQAYAQSCKHCLAENGLLTFKHAQSKVFTLQKPRAQSMGLLERLKNERIIVSHESDYLASRKWIQIALFGCYNREQLDAFIRVLHGG